MIKINKHKPLGRPMFLWRQKLPLNLSKAPEYKTCHHYTYCKVKVSKHKLIDNTNRKRGLS